MSTVNSKLEGKKLKGESVTKEINLNKNTEQNFNWNLKENQRFNSTNA